MHVHTEALLKGSHKKVEFVNLFFSFWSVSFLLVSRILRVFLPTRSFAASLSPLPLPFFVFVCVFFCAKTKGSDLPTYFFSNSPVRWRFTKVVLPVPPSPTRTSWESKKKCEVPMLHVAGFNDRSRKTAPSSRMRQLLRGFAGHTVAAWRTTPSSHTHPKNEKTEKACWCEIIAPHASARVHKSHWQTLKRQRLASRAI
jgi:hypothetical protein